MPGDLPTLSKKDLFTRLAEGLDLKPIYELMMKRDVIKVFHAARQDVEIFFHQAGVIPNPLFDTQVAAMVCGARTLTKV
jgi:ribonuclease D